MRNGRCTWTAQEGFILARGRQCETSAKLAHQKPSVMHRFHHSSLAMTAVWHESESLQIIIIKGLEPVEAALRLVLALGLLPIDGEELSSVPLLAFPA